MNPLVFCLNIFGPQRCQKCGVARPVGELVAERSEENGVLVGFVCRALEPDEHPLGLPL